MMSEKPVKTIADIARLAGVSKSTVSRALNNSSLIGQETRERIQSIARQHNFQLNLPAQRLSLKESHTIAYVTHASSDKIGCSVADMFMLEIIGAISSTLSEKHYDMLMAFVDPHDRQWPQQYLKTGRADGFILMTSTGKQAHIRPLLEINAPFIAWGAPVPGYSYCSVSGDNFNGGKLATGHLLQQGRQRIGFIGGPQDDLEVQGRYAGYQAALKEAGKEVDPALVVYGDFSSESGAERMAQLLERVPDLDAVFANSDLMAIAAMNLLHERGVRIPEDIAVVGYDGLVISENCNPPLTTIDQNISLAGRLLAQNLIQYLQTGLVTNVSIPAKLIQRKSA